MGKPSKIAQVRNYGLIGKTLQHSFSKSFFDSKFNSLGLNNNSYLNFEFTDEKSLADFLLEEVYDLKGFNITIPYKEVIIKYLDKLIGDAKEAKSVNTVLIKKGQLLGYNTDIFGFQESIKSLLKKEHQNALILGTGGASKSIVFALNKMGIQTTQVSRKLENTDFISYKDIGEEIMNSHQIIINCTPLGTYPNIDQSPDIPYHFLNNNHLVYDLVYNPEETLFLTNAKNRGATIQNGLQMLYLQAEKAWEIWNL
jgi:shikimate dehydrogenase